MAPTALLISALTVALAAYTAAAAAPPPPRPAATVTTAGKEWTLSNGYAKVVFSTGGLLRHGASIRSLSADWAGAGAYGEELLAGSGYTLEVQAAGGALASSADAAAVPTVTVRVLLMLLVLVLVLVVVAVLQLVLLVLLPCRLLFPPSLRLIRPSPSADRVQGPRGGGHQRRRRERGRRHRALVRIYIWIRAVDSLCNPCC